MKKAVTFVEISLFVCLIIALIAPQLFAADSEAIAKKLVNKLPDDAKRPTYYTGKHGFMNDKDLATEAGALEKGLYLMSWLATNPPVKMVSGTGGSASINKPVYKDFFGVAEADVTKSKGNYPRAGLKSKKANEEDPLKGEYIYWIPINFQDMVDAGEAEGFNSGNEFDWKERGFRTLEDYQMFIFCLVKWNKDTEVNLAAGSDDPSQTFVNGEILCEVFGDPNWARDTAKASFSAKGGQWIAFFVEVGERGGENGYTLRIEPPPSDHTLDIESALAVDSQGKTASTWGRIKVSY